jgi:hypothetical protein
MAFQFAWVCSRTVSQHVAQHLRRNTDISYESLPRVVLTGLSLTSSHCSGLVSTPPAPYLEPSRPDSCFVLLWPYEFVRVLIVGSRTEGPPVYKSLLR